MSEIYDLFQQGKSHLKKGRPAQATVALEKAKRRAPYKASIREALGIAYFRIHRYEEAASEFREMLELAPNDDYAHYALGRCLEKLGRATRGERALQARKLVASRQRDVRSAHPRPGLIRSRVLRRDALDDTVAATGDGWNGECGDGSTSRNAEFCHRVVTLSGEWLTPGSARRDASVTAGGRGR